MSTIWLMIKGMLMGIANIIPGVSGGTMAVSLGIYDDLIFSITHLFKQWRKSVKFLVPLGIGLAGGIIFFAYAIEFLLSEYTFPTSFAFVGLILGGLPILYQGFKQAMESKKQRLSFKHGLFFFIFFFLVAGLSFVQDPASATATVEITFINIIILFSIGVITSATMVVPGISGSLILMILGYYYTILNSLTIFTDNLRAYNWTGVVDGLMILVPFGIGILIGLFLISKLIEYLFINFPSLTYAGILGLVVASPIAILYNTGAFMDLAQQGSILYGIVGIALAVISFLLTYRLSMMEDSKADTEWKNA